MDTKKGAIILFAIAIILLLVSFTLMNSDSSLKTNLEEETEGTQGSGKIGINILPSEIEDKLVEENGK